MQQWSLGQERNVPKDLNCSHAWAIKEGASRGDLVLVHSLALWHYPGRYLLDLFLQASSEGTSITSLVPLIPRLGLTCASTAVRGNLRSVHAKSAFLNFHEHFYLLEVAQCTLFLQPGPTACDALYVAYLRCCAISYLPFTLSQNPSAKCLLSLNKLISSW